MSPLPALVLAAGASTRMGSPKALLPIGGVPAVVRVARTLADGGAGPVVVVAGCHVDEIRPVVKTELPGVVLLHNYDWELGRTSSVQAGLGALALVAGDAPGVVLAMTDMPFVRATTVTALLAAFDARPDCEVVVPVHDGRPGHPVALRSSLFDDLRALPHDAPLRDLLRTRPRAEVPVDDEGVLIDLDTPSDYGAAPPS